MGELTKREDEWQRQATAAAIAAARRVVLGEEAAINRNVPIGRLSDLEWGWVVTAVIFGWIKARAEQATAEGLDVEQAIRLTTLDPNPWDVGAISAILPQLADTADLDWSKPLAEWSREDMSSFLATAHALIRKAVIARDLGGGPIARKAKDVPSDPIPF